MARNDKETEVKDYLNDIQLSSQQTILLSFLLLRCYTRNTVYLCISAWIFRSINHGILSLFFQEKVHNVSSLSKKKKGLVFDLWPNRSVVPFLQIISFSLSIPPSVRTSPSPSLTSLFFLSSLTSTFFPFSNTFIFFCNETTFPLKLKGNFKKVL